MKKYSLITTSFCSNCSEPDKFFLKNKFNYDGDESDIYVNFSNEFSPFDFNKIPNVGYSKRKDLVYGKIFLLKKFIEENILGKYEYLCHIDYSDTKFCGSFIEMMNKFSSSENDLIISTEKNAWPYIDELNKWTDKNLEENEFTFLNSGAVISKTEIFYKMLDNLINICLTINLDFWDDQGVWQYYDICVSPLKKDINCEYFFSTALLDDTYYIIDNSQIKTKFNTIPYLIHDNSSFSLNLIKTI
jgi:hypothetical protein